MQDAVTKDALVRQMQDYQQQLQAELEAIGHAITAMRAGGSHSTAKPRSLHAPAPMISDLNSLPPKKAVLAFLKDNPTKAFRASEVKHALAGAGVKTESKTFASTVTTALRRLVAKKQVIAEAGPEGWTVYRIAESPSAKAAYGAIGGQG
jgi:hypothetical protein